MALLRLEDNTVIFNLDQIRRELAALQICIEPYAVPQNPELAELLAQDILSFAQKEQVLAPVASHFDRMKQEQGYKWRDLVVLHPGSPHLAALNSGFDRCHTHSDRESLGVLAGECIFGFVRPDGTQMELLVTAGEFVSIPAGREHWFSLTAQLHLKAARYFTTVSGWLPQYTDTAISFLRC